MKISYPSYVQAANEMQHITALRREKNVSQA